MIREFRDSDVPGIVRLLQEVYPEMVQTEAGFRHRLATIPARARRRRWCAEEDGKLVAWASGGLLIYSARDDVAGLDITVHPDFRRRGIGASLYEQVDAHLAGQGVRRVLTHARDEPSARRFAEARGFVHTRTDRASKLDPRDVDLSPLDALARAKQEEGFRLVPMSELRERPELIFELDVAASRDMPTDEPIGDVRFDEWLDSHWRHPDVTFEGSFVVLHEDRAVSFALLRADRAERKALNDMTGTLAEYRGRGLARLAKLATIAWAVENGITAIVTDNDETNRPMLAINRRLGYRVIASELAYVREISPAFGDRNL